jgi:hypothetical protein
MENPLFSARPAYLNTNAPRRMGVLVRRLPSKHLARAAHDLYFDPKYEEFRPRTIWSRSNAFTSAFKEPDPIPQFKDTVKLSVTIRQIRRRKRWIGQNKGILDTRGEPAYELPLTSPLRTTRCLASLEKLRPQ